MVGLRKYATRLQEAIGKEYAPGRDFADDISDSLWFEIVVREIDKMSIECARALQQETGATYRKPGYDFIITPTNRYSIYCLEIINCALPYKSYF